MVSAAPSGTVWVPRLPFRSAAAGATRAALEGGATPKMVGSLREQLVMLWKAYLAAAGGAAAGGVVAGSLGVRSRG
jgi:hypothetical protein